jgi:predicted nuclease with TOPRIM domain
MRTYKVMLLIRGECEDDATELLEGYIGKETHLEIKEISDYEKELKDESNKLDDEIETKGNEYDDLKRRQMDIEDEIGTLDNYE